jgi:putative transposase
MARGAPRCSPGDRDSLASAGLSRLLDPEVPARANGSTSRRFGAYRTRPYHGAGQSPLGRTAHPRRLLKLGFDVSQRTVARLMPRRPKPPSQTWLTFLQNHVAELVSVDFLVVPTATFRVLYVFVVLLHHRRKVVHFNVTDSPTAAWTAQQIVEAFPDDSARRYLVRDRDSIYGGEFRRRVEGIGLVEVLTAPRSPWQNPFAERMIGTIRRELLDHVIILNEEHLRRRLRSYLRYYHGSRTHLALGKDAPDSRDRATRTRPRRCAAPGRRTPPPPRPPRGVGRGGYTSPSTAEEVGRDSARAMVFRS